MFDQQKIVQIAQKVLDDEARAIQQTKEQLSPLFATCCQRLLNCKGRIVVTGMGKSGHIGRKIAATLASTGSPSFFVHPGEAGHGDMGMITPDDVVLALSNSGETDEIITLLPIIKRLAIPLITLTGNPNSTLAKNAEVNLDVSVAEEACPLNLAPTSSTTAALAMGDAIAVCLLHIRGFTKEEFAHSHPSGKLGRRLLLKVSDIMHTGASIPKVSPEASISDALMEMSQKGLGLTAITDTNDHLLGIFTDGDLRRSLDKDVDLKNTPLAEVMTTQCKTCCADTLASEVLQIMESSRINAILVVNANSQLVGALNMHDLLQARII